MMYRVSTIAFFSVCAVVQCDSQAHSDDAFRNVAPKSTVIYAEIEPSDQWINHPLRTKLVASEAFQSIWKSPEIIKTRGGITMAEFALGDKLENIISNLASGGVSIAVDSETQGIVVVGTAVSEEWLQQYLERVVELMRGEATKNGDSDAIKKKDYRGAVAYENNQTIFGSFGKYFIVTNKPALAKVTVDRLVDKVKDGLVSSESFQKAIAERNSTSSGQPFSSLGWIYIDVATLRDAGIAKELLGGVAKDFGAELLIGGLLSTLHSTNYVTGDLMASDRQLELALSSPHDTSSAEKSRAFHFEPSTDSPKVELIDSANSLASLSAYRDISQMWLRAGDLFDQGVNDQLAQADNTLTTLFSGRDFGQDILGAIYPRLQMISEENVFVEGYPKPSIRLPSFALIATLRDAETMQPQLKRIFQSLIGFLNIVGAMEGGPQLDQNTQTIGDVQTISATYVPDVDRKKLVDAPIQFNFSPCLAFRGDTVILSSTTHLAESIMSRPKAQESSVERNIKAHHNTFLTIDGKAVKSILESNRGQLVAQNMLEKGHSKKDAEQEIGILLSLISVIQSASLDLDFSEQADLKVTVEIVDE